MTQAITKTWLRRQHKASKSDLPFRKWCRGDGKNLVEMVVASDQYHDGPNFAVSKLTGVEMGEGAGLAHLSLLEVQKARKGRSLVKAAATKLKKRSGKKKGKGK